MVNESEYKEIIKEVESLNSKDKKLLDIAHKLLDNYFIQIATGCVCKVYSIGVNLRNEVCVMAKTIRTYTTQNPGAKLVTTDWYSIDYFVVMYDLISKEKYEKVVDDLCIYLKS